MPITTEVSTSPRAQGASATGRRILIDVSVDVGSEFLVVDVRSTLERGKENVSGDELTPFIRMQLTDRPAVAGDDEVLARVERPHHLATVVAKLSLGQFPRH